MAISMGIKVAERSAHRAKEILKEQDVLDKKKPKHGGGVVFPVKHLGFDLGKIPFEVVEAEFKDFKRDDGFEELLKRIRCSMSSYDVIGDIAILEIPNNCREHKKEIAETLISSRPHIKAAFKKSSAVQGEKRVRGFEWLSGEKRTETIHRELGCEFKLNFSKVFFSPRLSYERQRIKDQVKKGEMIVDMFAGVGPYSIVIAKHREIKALGFDINEEAIQYFKENIRLNRLGDRVRALHGDCSELAPAGVADRVIMNLPKMGREYLDTAVETLKPSGGIVHYYGISQRINPFEDDSEYILKMMLEKNKKANIYQKRIVRSYSPGEVHIALDVEVTG
jgi:tRNA (guanine37-N1)-methyltransferase